MEAWLQGEHTYTKVTISPRLQAGFSEAVRALICSQIKEALGGPPISYRWERGGVDIIIGAAI
jgi:hypothetical protein